MRKFPILVRNWLKGILKGMEFDEKDQYDMTFGEVPSQGYENFSGIKDEGHINAAKTFEKKNTDPFQNQSKKIKNHIVNQKFLEPAKKIEEIYNNL